MQTRPRRCSPLRSSAVGQPSELHGSSPATRRIRAAHLAIEGILVIAFAALTIAVHPIQYMLHQPYWGDEAWVAILARAPLHQYITISSSSPIGFELIVRWAPFGRDALRLVGLAFSGATVVTMYLGARSLRWPNATQRHLAGVIAATLAMFAPIALMRSDLKQYNGDAWFAVLILICAASAERTRTRTALVRFVCIGLIALPFSTTSAFVSIACGIALVIVELRTRATKPREFRNTVIAIAAIVTGIGLYFAAVLIPHNNPALQSYWTASYLRGNPFRIGGEIWRRLNALRDALAMPAWIFIALFAVGVCVLAKLGQRVLAVAVPLLWSEMVAAGIAQRYPFLDQRTSHFLLMASLFIIAIGVTGALVWIYERQRIVASLALAFALTGFLSNARPFLRNESIPLEDVRSQVDYLAPRWRPRDIVLVNYTARYAFGVYWPHANSTFSSDFTGQNPNGFLTKVTNIPNLVYAMGRHDRHTPPAVAQAIALWRRGPHSARIWLIRSHVQPWEKTAWDRAFRGLGVTEHLIAVGNEPLTYLTVP